MRPLAVAALLALAACGSSSSEEGTPDASLGADGSGAPSLDGSSPRDTGSDAIADAGPTALDGAIDATPPPPGAGCGWHDAGTTLHVAANLDVCLPSVACNSEVCPPTLGDCVNGACVFKAGYSGVATLPEAWVTYYCTLSTQGCHGVTQVEYPEVTAQKIATARGLPLCESAPGGTTECVGIAASPPMIVGNSQLADDRDSGQQVKDWGLGLTEASGLCYELEGAGGKAIVALTDRCGGYCKCNGSGFQECGPCVNALDMETNCPCVGTAPPAYGSCCGATCGGTVNAQCDWCASNNHPHFDLDTGTFNYLCAANANLGSCKLTAVRFVPCMAPTTWPPP